MAQQTEMTRVGNRRGIERTLCAARASVMRDANQTTIEKQDEITEKWANASGRALVATAADTNVSGASDPFGRKMRKGKWVYERPELGPWLMEPELIAQWDTLVAATLDRLARSTKHFGRLVDWAKENNKKIVCLDIMGGQADFTEGWGQFIGFVMSWLAQQERELTKERILKTLGKNRREGKWSGGVAIYGYKSVCLCHKQRPCPTDDPTGAWLVIDPERAAIVREIADRVIAGETLQSIARDLTRREIPSGGKVMDPVTGKSTGVPSTQWINTRIKIMLQSPTLKGQMVHYPDGARTKAGRDNWSVVRDPETNEPIQFYDPILTDEKWLAVNNKMDADARPWVASNIDNRGDAYLLSAIAKCPCGIKYYHQGKNVDHLRDYYSLDSVKKKMRLDTNNKPCPHQSVIRTEDADAELDGWIKSHTFMLFDDVYEADPYDALKADLTHQEDKARQQRDRKELSFAEYMAEVSRINEALEALDNMPAYNPKPKRVNTGKTLGSEWPIWTVQQKRQFLVERNFEVIMYHVKDETGGIPEDYDGWLTGKNTKLVKCPGCGKNATNTLGTCAEGAKQMRKGTHGNACQLEYTRRTGANYRAKKSTGKKVYSYDANRVVMTMVPGWLFEAEYFGLPIDDRATYNARMEEMSAKGNLPDEWTEEGLWLWKDEAMNRHGDNETSHS